MKRLLSANFARLRRDIAFWCVAVLVLVSAVVNAVTASQSFHNLLAMGFAPDPDNYFYNNAPMMGLFYAAFVSLFLGTEYSDGTMRNKLLVGHPRGRVYVAGLLTCFAGCAFLALLWMVGCLPMLLVGKLEIGLESFALHALVILGFTAAFVSLFTLIGSLSTNKALTVVFCLGVWLALLLAASGAYDRLCEPELESGVVLTVEGLQRMDPEPNPLYVSGAVRRVLEAFLDFLPMGQTILMSDNAMEHPLRQLLFSGVFTMGTTAAGLLAFRRKDIK